MKLLLQSLLLLTLTAASALAEEPRTQPPLDGIWAGTLDPQGQALRVVLKVVLENDGSFSASLDSPDQGVQGIPVDQISSDSGFVHLKLSMIQSAFDGAFSASADSIFGQWRQSGVTLPLLLVRTGDMLAPVRPQESAVEENRNYDEQDISIGNLQANVRLAGTLALPREGGPFPAVILITGSGPQDRNEETAGHRPFLVLSDHLARRGIAVLRIDDRGVGKSTGKFEAATSQDFAADIEAALVLLKSRSDIDPKRIGLVGHSEGALVAGIVAARNPAVAFIVSISGPALPGDRIVYAQTERLARAEGVPDSVIAANVDLSRKLFEVAKSQPDSAKAAKELRAVLIATIPEAAAEEARATLDAQISQLLSPWFRFFLRYDPAADLGKLAVPYLAVYGEKDLQVPPDINRAPLETALAAAGNTRYTVEVLPGLNHLMQTAATGSPGEYMTIEETFAPAALEVIGNWIVATVR